MLIVRVLGPICEKGRRVQSMEYKITSFTMMHRREVLLSSHEVLSHNREKAS
jgi:hypothetical protein